MLLTVMLAVVFVLVFVIVLVLVLMIMFMFMKMFVFVIVMIVFLHFPTSLNFAFHVHYAVYNFVNQIGLVIVSYVIIHFLTALARLKKSCRFQHFQMVRYSGKAHLNGCRYIGHAVLGVAKQCKYF